MKNTLFTKLFLLGFFAAASVSISSAQDGTRSITSADFASQRPAPPLAASSNNPVVKRAKPLAYKFVRADKNIKTSKGTKRPVAATDKKGAAKFTEIGVTMWRMRPPKPGESGYFIPVVDENKSRQSWLAERVGTDTVFKAGDKVRIGVESSSAGYLYVFDREKYSDGSFGEPYLIFPESERDDNSVKPGMLVDIPDQRQDVPYFNMNPRGDRYNGELLTIVISPTPMANLKADAQGKLDSGDSLAELEFGTEVEIFSRVDTGDKIYSKTESESACGTKTRQLERDKSATGPCGPGTRQLTREEPLPQSIYRVKGVAGKPVVAFVKMSVQ